MNRSIAHTIANRLMKAWAVLFGLSIVAVMLYKPLTDAREIADWAFIGLMIAPFVLIFPIFCFVEAIKTRAYRRAST